jgi:hypothetical protein
MTHRDEAANKKHEEGKTNNYAQALLKGHATSDDA